MSRMPGRDIFRRGLGELIEEYLVGLVEEKQIWLENCVVELEDNGIVSIKRANGERFSIIVRHHASR